MQETGLKLKALLDSAESIKSLPVGAREDLVNKLLALSDEQMEAIIKILEEEKDKVAAIKEELKKYGDKISDLFARARQAGRELKIAFTRAKEEEHKGAESERTDELLEKL